MWTLYGHIDGEGVQAIGDFDTKQHAEETFQCITGIPFSGSREVMDRLRVMHAGQKLLETLIAASDWINAQIGVARTEIQAQVQQIIAEATGRAA